MALILKPRRFEVRRSMPGIATSGIKAWYQAKNNAKDSMGNANGTAIGSLAYKGGPAGLAFSLDGTTAYVQITYASALASTTLESLSVWIYLNQLPGVGVSYHIFGQSTNGNDNDLLIGYSVTNALQFFGWPSGGGALTSTYTLVPLTWTHIVVTLDSANNLRAMYINGALSITSACTARANSTNDWSIGESLVFPGRKFKGLISDVRMYSTALTALQVKQIYTDDLKNYARPRRNNILSNQVPALSSNLKAWFRAENNVTDTTGKVTAAWVNPAVYAAGAIGQAFSFGGANYIRITYNGNLAATTAETIALWLRLASAPGVWMVAGQSTNSNDNDLLFNGGTLQFYGFGATLSSTQVFSTLTWYHVAIVVNTTANNKTIYVNGISKGSTSAGARANSVSDWSIAESLVFGGRQFKGQMDEVQVYNSALTQAQVIQLMNGQVLYEPIV